MPSESALASLAKHWNLHNIVFIRKMENIVFSCGCPSGKVYLRLTTPLRRKKPEIVAEIHWIEHLAKSGLKVPKILPDASGNKVVSFLDGDQHSEAVVFSAITGEHPQKHVVTTPQFLKTLGSLIAKMHKASQGYTHPGEKREEWLQERGLRHALIAAKTSKEIVLRDLLEKSLSWMKGLPRDESNYGLVHADLGALNLFIGEDDTIGIIDFDDSCYHWYAFDLAIVIFSMAGRFEHTHSRPEEMEWLSHLLTGYRTVRPCSEQEALLIPRFIQFAALRLFFWIQSHEAMGTFHADALEKVKKLTLWAKNRVINTQEVPFRFSHARPEQRALLHQWFEQKHIKEWMHGVGLQNTLNGLEKFFQGKGSTTYWIGYDGAIPFAFLITSPKGEDATTLDVFICDTYYLGKGLAVPMIKEFLKNQFSHLKRVLIDPEKTNTRAIHVYEKVGFKITHEFIASWHPVPHFQMELHMKNLLNSTRT